VRDAAGRSTISYEDFACAVVDELKAARHVRQIMRAHPLSPTIESASAGMEYQ
jgi:hypothetical protein